MRCLECCGQESHQQGCHKPQPAARVRECAILQVAAVLCRLLCASVAIIVDLVQAFDGLAVVWQVRFGSLRACSRRPAHACMPQMRTPMEIVVVSGDCVINCTPTRSYSLPLLGSEDWQARQCGATCLLQAAK